MIVAHAVLEILREDEFTLWPVAEYERFHFMPLHGGLEPAEIGTAVTQIADYTDFVTDDSHYPRPRPTEPLGAFLHGLLAMDDPEAPGGVRFTDTTTGVTVLPGCCGALEEWRGWYDIADGGSAFFGHNPSAFGELTGDMVWLSVDVDVEDADSQTIDLPVTELRRLLAGVETDLIEFLRSTAAWAAWYVPDHAVPVIAALARLLDLPAPAVPE